ncbi:MAG: isopentenyl phosphate kinase family protein [Chloroflexi bacterium]|nr:isopentenyl phosphate kinase family protein [Chloroflexota bacterium]
MAELIFLKLGGSLITDKDRPYTPRLDKLDSLAKQISAVLFSDPETDPASKPRLILGHGSGSFGHTSGKKYGTRDGVRDASGWKGFAEVWIQARELNVHVMNALYKAGIPAMAFPPSSAVLASDAQVSLWETTPIRMALANGILPVIHGDVAFDEVRGGTILSTEDLFMHLARQLFPNRILLAGIEAGVWDDFPARTRLVKEIRPEVYEKMREKVGGSVSADVTGGMAAKVEQMLELVREVPGLTAQIFSAEEDHHLARALNGENVGTLITM